jgi:hypothetical protein
MDLFIVCFINSCVKFFNIIIIHLQMDLLHCLFHQQLCRTMFFNIIIIHLQCHFVLSQKSVSVLSHNLLTTFDIIFVSLDILLGKLLKPINSMLFFLFLFSFVYLNLEKYKIKIYAWLSLVLPPNSKEQSQCL